jgi:hypothetical protein
MGRATNSPVLRALAERYRKTRAGRHEDAVRDLVIGYETLLKAASASEGEARVVAERDLQDAERSGYLRIERHRRTQYPLNVRFSRENEDALFVAVGLEPPAVRRAQLAELFERAVGNAVPDRWGEGWTAFCEWGAAASRRGDSVAPFSRDKPREVEEILGLLPRILAWPEESLIRFASSHLCGNSKRLGELARCLDQCLERITGGALSSLADAGILANERSLLLHGPVQFVLEGGIADLSPLRSPARISSADVRRAEVRTNAVRCVTVENAAMLQELAKRNRENILASSGSEGGFAHSAIVDFLKALPADMELWHFGDADPKGFEILADLRARTQREIHALGMWFRDGREPLTLEDGRTIGRLLVSPYLTENEKAVLQGMKECGRKGKFEQESLGVPGAAWPWYRENQ